MTRTSSRNARRAGAALALLLAAAGPASADGRLAGHLSVGYAQLMTAGAPGGNISFTGGVDLPLRRTLRIGADLGYDLLGTRSVERGSLSASVSYSAFETALFAHWLPDHLGPLGRVSVGPLLMAAHADLSAAAGGAGFSDLAVGETAGGVAGEATFISRSASPVRLGLQLGARSAFLAHETWTLLSARLTIHY
jgi:hypothetical protein